MRSLSAALLLVTALAAAGAVPPEPVQLPRVLTLAEALRIFQERGFDLLIAEAAVQGARGEEIAAGAIANPLFSGSAGRSFGYDPSQCGGPGCSTTAISLGISDQAALWDLLARKRGLRREVAGAALAAAKLVRKDAQRILQFTLKQQYFQATLARAQREFAREVRASTARTRELTARRFSLGAINEADLAKIEVAALEAEQALDQAEQAFTVARVQVAFLLGVQSLAADFDVDPGTLEFRLPPAVAGATPEALFDVALQSRPDLQASDAQMRRAEAAVRLARRQRLPDVSLSAAYTQEGTGQNAITPPTLTFGLTLPLPIFYQQQGEILRAEADLRTQTLLNGKLRAQVAADLQTALGAFRTSRRLVERMQGRLLERAKRARDLVQVQYEKGAASLLELLDAQRTYIAVNGEYLQNLTGYWNAVAQLEQAVGKEL